MSSPSPPRWRKAGVDSWIGRKPARGALSAENGNIREAARRVAPLVIVRLLLGGGREGAKSDGKTMPPGPP